MSPSLKRVTGGLPALGSLVFAACIGGSTNTIAAPVIDPVRFVSVSTGALHSCGLDDQGRALCWGDNRAGQLGDSSFLPRAVPGFVATDQRFVALSAGSAHVCAINEEQALYCWGANQFAQLGLQVSISGGFASPVGVPGGGEFIDVATGDAHTCAITTDGEAFCWGLADDGRLGDGSSGFFVVQPVPQAVEGGLVFTSIDAGLNHTCALTDVGEAYCWGAGARGQLGQAASGNSAEPVLVAGGHTFVSIAAGGRHTCGVTDTGTALCWGRGIDGQLGDGQMVENKDEPVPVGGGLLFRNITAGDFSTCGVTDTNVGYCWGANDAGQLGTGNNDAVAEPAMVSGALAFQSMSASVTQTSGTVCGLTVDNLLYCWGLGSAGQIGNGLGQTISTPQLVLNQR